MHNLLKTAALILFLSLGLLLGTPETAGATCFLVKENHKIIQQEGNCTLRHSPCSTFKIALSLMGYDQGILKDETHPSFPFKEGYLDYIEGWRVPHNPLLWMKDSCVWYSQILTQKLGIAKFTEYVTKFNYGNQDVSGDKGKHNGLTYAWLSSSLEISPEEQAIFLQKLIDNQLPVSLKAHEMTRNIIFKEALPNGWKLYGKTGSCSLLNRDRTKKLDIQQGWFVGWIQKNLRTIVVVTYITDDEKQDLYAGPRAYAYAKEKLLKLMDVLENKDTP